MEKKEIREILNFMNALYPNRKIQMDSSVIETWMIMFDGYGKDEVIQSIKNLSRRIKYIPNIPEILDEIKHVFKTEMKRMGGVVIVRVIFHDEIIPFKFKDSSKLQEFISFLKTSPPVEDIKYVHMNNILEMNQFACISAKAMEIYASGNQKKSKQY